MVRHKITTVSCEFNFKLCASSVVEGYMAGDISLFFTDVGGYVRIACLFQLFPHCVELFMH